MTELAEAVADIAPEAEERRRARLAAALYEAIKGNKQVELVEFTGLTRETIRRHVEDERIRRGEIDPTPRYVAEQAKREQRERQRRRRRS